MEEQLTTVQHEVIQRQLCLQELEEQLQGSQGRGVVLQQKVDEYCSSVEKLEQELVNTQQKYQIAVQEVCDSIIGGSFIVYMDQVCRAIGYVVYYDPEG